MKNQYKTRILSAVLVICLSLCSLIGGTYAWFTDSLRTGKSRIVSGTLDVEMYYKNAKTSIGMTGADRWKNVVLEDTSDPLFFVDESGEEMLWKPGMVSVCDFEIRNEGNLALKYKFNTTYTDGNDAKSDKKLSDVILAAVVPADTDTSTRQKAIDAGKANGGFSALDTVCADGVLAAKGSTVTANKTYAGATDTAAFRVILYWEPDVLTDNDYNMNNENAGKSMWIDVDIRVVATQFNEEADSFGIDYPEAPFPSEKKD